MSQTILLQDNPKLRQLYSLNLQTYTGTNIIERANAAEVIELIKILPSIGLIITDEKVGQEQTAKLICDFLEVNLLDIPMIVLGTQENTEENILRLKKPITWELLIRNAGILLEVRPEMILSHKKEKPVYKPVKLDIFDYLEQVPCDIYIKIKQSHKEHQFIKRFNKNTRLAKNEIEKYKSQGIRHFYVTEDYLQYFVTFVTNQLVMKLENSETSAQKIIDTAHCYDFIREQISESGVTKEIIELTESSIHSMIESINVSPKLGNLLQFLFRSKISYAYKKAHLVAVMGNYIISKQKWYQKKHLEYFTTASFLSDIALNSTHQMEIQTAMQLESSFLSNEEKMEVWEHAKRAEEIYKAFPEYNPEIAKVIREHHGALNGVGLLDEYTDEISAFSQVFIVVDAFVKILLDSSTPKNKREILSILYIQYPADFLQRIIQFLESRVE